MHYKASALVWSTLSFSQSTPVNTPLSSRIVNTLCISEAIHSALKNGVKLNSFPELSDAASIALYTVSMIQGARDNNEACRNLIDSSCSYTGCIVKLCQEGKLKPEIIELPISDLVRNLKDIRDCYSEFLQTDRWTKMVLYHIKYRSQFKRLQRRINQSIAKFEISMSVDFASVLSELQESYNSKSDQASNTGGINQRVQINSGINTGIQITGGNYSMQTNTGHSFSSGNGNSNNWVPLTEYVDFPYNFRLGQAPKTGGVNQTVQINGGTGTGIQINGGHNYGVQINGGRSSGSLVIGNGNSKNGVPHSESVNFIHNSSSDQASKTGGVNQSVQINYGTPTFSGITNIGRPSSSVVTGNGNLWNSNTISNPSPSHTYNISPNGVTLVTDGRQYHLHQGQVYADLFSK
ncbi:hypothetical protein B0H34DRAFT_716386 [Crassisporium funariophilum]|nr:hypothetical protein B0H34DRAFT_716386 [Crassisporium funariophilum]